MKYSIEWLLRPIPLLLWLAGTFPTAALAKNEARDISGEGVQFDLGVLKASGIDPGVAEYFSLGARFVPGRSRASLSVNGADRGSAEVRIDEGGRLCVDDGFWTAAGLQPTAGPPPAEAGCRELTAFYPQAVVKLRPELARVDILVPSGALRRKQEQLGAHDSGGTAGVFNYEVLAMRSSGGGRSQQYLQGFTEIGFNWQDWMVRSRQSFARNGASNRFQYLYSYAQKTLVGSKAILQVGELSLNNPLFAGVNFSGAQWLPQGALLPRGNLPQVRGIAQSEARVEVRQAGALVYSTLVPPGAFELNDVPILSAGFDLNVTVTESDGGQHAFTVPAAAFFCQPGRRYRGFQYGGGQTAPVQRPGWRHALVVLRQPQLAAGPGTGSQFGGNVVRTLSFHRRGLVLSVKPWNGGRHACRDLPRRRGGKERRAIQRVLERELERAPLRRAEPEPAKRPFPHAV